jgi:hypothetical protein
VEDPLHRKPQVVLNVENQALLPYVVELWVELFVLLSVCQVVDVRLENGFQKEGEGGEDHVIVGDEIIVVEGLGREAIEISQEELGNCENSVFVEEIQN